MFTRGIQSRWSLTPILLVTVLLTAACWEALAQGSGSPAETAGKDQQSSRATIAKAASKAKAKSVSKVGADSAQSQEIDMLKKLIAAQQQQIEQLRVAMEEQKHNPFRHITDVDC